MSPPLFRKPTAADRRDRWSWHLGRILGIPTRIHASFALVLLWVGISTWSSAHSGIAVVFGLAFALAIFACVLLHEFGHALVAREFGIETRRITLLPIGGVAELERSPEDPRAEMWIAAAGPAVNFAIAAGLGLIGFATGIFSGAGLLGVVFSGLVWANLLLGLFNLVPAFPMDGGRVFRAWASRRYGRVRAMELAARLGRALAVGFGLWGLFGSNPVLVLVAVFVWFAAGRELAGVRRVAAFERERQARAQWVGGQFWRPHDRPHDRRHDPGAAPVGFAAPSAGPGWIDVEASPSASGQRVVYVWRR